MLKHISSLKDSLLMRVQSLGALAKNKLEDESGVGVIEVVSECLYA